MPGARAFCRDRSSSRGVARRSATTVTALIQSLAHDAQVEASKCTPRCLRKLYLQTQERILHNISTLAREEYEKLLRSEQEKTGWNA